jgi:hypothetical protein
MMTYQAWAKENFWKIFPGADLLPFCIEIHNIKPKSTVRAMLRFEYQKYVDSCKGKKTHEET